MDLGLAPPLFLVAICVFHTVISCQQDLSVVFVQKRFLCPPLLDGIARGEHVVSLLRPLPYERWPIPKQGNFYLL